MLVIYLTKQNLFFKPQYLNKNIRFEKTRVKIPISSRCGGYFLHRDLRD